MGKCYCFSCKFGRLARTVMVNGSHRQKNRLITDLLNSLASAEEDNSYYSCILDGSWPQAVEILERSLEKARAIELKEEE